MPREGTETLCVEALGKDRVFGNKMPREGTETIFIIFTLQSHLSFGNKMPREGTETRLSILRNTLEVVGFGNKMPREGTKTVLIFYNIFRQRIWK